MKSILLLVFLFASFAVSTAGAVDVGEPPTRSNIYPDDTRDEYVSGWKAMITNMAPHRTLESGRWFEAAPEPRPFKVVNKPIPFSNEMRARLQKNSTDALIVVKDGEIVQQYFRYGFNIDDIHLLHSTGKVFTSFAIQPVYDRIGSEGLDRPLNEYLPKLKGKFFGEATLKQALNMKNGMEWTENYEDPTTATMLSGPVGGWDPTDKPESWYERMFDFPKYGDHGKTWVYSNASPISVAFAAAVIDGRDFSQLVQDSYNKLGFEDRSWYVQNKFDEFSAEGGQALTIRDYAKLGRYMLETKDSQYVDDVWNTLADPSDPGGATYLKKYGDLFGSDGYTSYWYRMGSDVIMAIGSSGQFLYVNRAKNLVISKFSSNVQGQNPAEFLEALDIIKTIANGY